MATDKVLLKEVTKDLWKTVNKLRPDLDKDARLQLVLKALLTIGDLPNHIEAAIVVGICAEMEEVDDPNESGKEVEKKNNVSDSQDASNGRRVVRRRSAAG